MSHSSREGERAEELGSSFFKSGAIPHLFHQHIHTDRGHRGLYTVLFLGGAEVPRSRVTDGTFRRTRQLGCGRGVPPNGGPNRNNVTLVAFLACSVVKESRNLRHGSWLAILCDGLNGLPYPLRCASPFLLGVVPFHVHVVTGSTPGGAGTHT